MAKENQCGQCIGLCCRYVALPIETPEDKQDYDDIRWFLCHEGVTIFVEDGDWYINIKNKCRHLSGDDYRCMIYDKRPKICRKYKYKDCDFVEGEYEYELHFTDDKQMAEYIRIKFDNNKIEKPKRAAMRNAKKNRSVIRSISGGGSAKDKERLVTKG
ncbi:MAG: YkgJ family cysteine cluster protein [Sedimentisphaerales bacterium]|nr:YkgJ family cysteine cluster protein [Sedimentisphaerales bacterium]